MVELTNTEFVNSTNISMNGSAVLVVLTCKICKKRNHTLAAQKLNLSGGLIRIWRLEKIDVAE